MAILLYLGDRPISVAAAPFLTEEFEGYGNGDDPLGWLDAGANNSLTEDNSMFKMFFPVVNTLSAITMTLNIQGNGTVSLNPDKAQYSYGEKVTLTASADPGWEFAGWNGDLSGNNNPVTLAMTTDKVLTAIFTALSTNTLTISVSGDGTVDVDPLKPGYDFGEVVTLTATANPGWVFAGWSGDLTGSANPETLTMNGDKTVTATFTEITHTLTVSTVGSGTVTVNPVKAQDSDGEVVTLTATADPGWVFAGWSGDLIGSTNPEMLTMDGDKTVTATFTEITHTLTVSTVGNGTVTLNPDKVQYSGGEVVTLTAAPDSGWVFAGWSGDLTGVTNPETLTMDGDKTVTATFDIDPNPSYPSIDVWYGTEQQFGQPGVPQQWVNILGDVTDPDGIATLTYSLNG